jgi:hypothetical protein
MSNLPTCPSYTLCNMFLDLSTSWGILESQRWAPLEKTQNGSTYNALKTIKTWLTIKMNMSLEYQYAHDIGRYECRMAEL